MHTEERHAALGVCVFTHDFSAEHATRPGQHSHSMGELTGNQVQRLVKSGVRGLAAACGTGQRP